MPFVTLRMRWTGWPTMEARQFRDEWLWRSPPAARRVVERPLIGHVRPELLPHPFRVWAVQDFPYLLIYDAGTVPPKILRVLHMARDLAPLVSDLGPGSRQ